MKKQFTKASDLPFNASGHIVSEIVSNDMTIAERTPLTSSDLPFTESGALAIATQGGGGGEGAPKSNLVPLMDGTATPGTEYAYSSGNHRHPTDTSRAAVSDLASHTGNLNNPHQTTLAMLGGVTQDAVETMIAEAKLSTLALVGIISPTDPITGGQPPNRGTKNYWLQSSSADMPTTFPIAVKSWDFDLEDWETVQYTPEQLELWQNVNITDQSQYYYWLNGWVTMGVDMTSYLTAEQINALRDNVSIVLNASNKWTVSTDWLRGQLLFDKLEAIAPNNGTLTIDPSRPVRGFTTTISDATTVAFGPVTVPANGFRDVELWINLTSASAVTWPSSETLTWVGGTPTLTAGKINVIIFRTTDGVNYVGNKGYEA